MGRAVRDAALCNYCTASFNFAKMCIRDRKKAVAAGYWNLFSFNPAAKAEGKNPFTLTSKAGDMSKYCLLYPSRCV